MLHMLVYMLANQIFFCLKSNYFSSFTSQQQWYTDYFCDIIKSVVAKIWHWEYEGTHEVGDEIYKFVNTQIWKMLK